jgi:hypothetical protein
VQINSDILRLMSSQSFAYSPAALPTKDDRAVQSAVDVINGSDLLGYDREFRYSKDLRTNQNKV